MKLDEIIKNLNITETVNTTMNPEIKGISYNSQTTKAGDIFVCLKGEYSDGHNWVKMAKDRGAIAILCEKKLDINLPLLIVNNTKIKIAELANLFYDHPSDNTNLIGVTGTNGKTTVTHLIQKILEANSQKCALIGTLGYKLSEKDTYHDAKHTTPQAPELQATLKKIADNNIDTTVIEVSSHALEQHRVAGCNFKGAVFTNLTQDHLDYHITMENYFDAKAILFKGLKKGTFAVINKDDKYSERFIKILPQDVRLITYSTKDKTADLVASNISFNLTGVSFNCVIENKKNIRVNLKMNGLFSVYNVLAALGTVFAMNMNLEKAIKELEKTTGVAGRFETVHHHPLVIVDYAHTPDGLENVLKTAKEIKPQNGNLICLFGCGGDRDATKRPKMATIADKLADKLIITSDNPRSEDPQQIISDIMTGIESIDTSRIFVEADRGIAISLIKNIASENDIVIVAGKGHENYQILQDKTIHFDDKEEIEKLYN